jgi:hypothetical protein
MAIGLSNFMEAEAKGFTPFVCPISSFIIA